MQFYPRPRMIVRKIFRYMLVERRYSVTHIELLVVVVSLNCFRKFLLGRVCALIKSHWYGWLCNFKEPEGLEKLEKVQFEVVHHNGNVYCNTDALSHIPDD